MEKSTNKEEQGVADHIQLFYEKFPLLIRYANFKNIFYNILEWLIFSVCISVLPILFACIAKQVRDDGNFDIINCVKGGELAIISVGLCAGVLKEMLASKKTLNQIGRIFFGLVILMMVFSSFVFAFLYLNNFEENERAFNLSIAVFVSSIITCFPIIILTTKR